MKKLALDGVIGFDVGEPFSAIIMFKAYKLNCFALFCIFHQLENFGFLDIC